MINSYKYGINETDRNVVITCIEDVFGLYWQKAEPYDAVGQVCVVQSLGDSIMTLYFLRWQIEASARLAGTVLQ